MVFPIRTEGQTFLQALNPKRNEPQFLEFEHNNDISFFFLRVHIGLPIRSYETLVDRLAPR